MHKGVKRFLGVGIAAGAGYAIWRAWSKAQAEPGPRPVEWSSAPFPFPPVPRPGAGATSAESAAGHGHVHVPPEVEPGGGPATEAEGEAHVPDWMGPNDDGTCPATHPVKGKLASGIFHVPGGANYDRTQADRCYVDEEAAVRDGLRRSKV